MQRFGRPLLLKLASDAAAFDRQLAACGELPLRRDRLTTLQVNVGLRCNLACHHCHVESGPKRREALSRAGVERVLELLAASEGVAVLDLTGGAPELHPEFRALVAGARRLGRRVIDRCNLTVLGEPGQEGTAEFLARQGADIMASLPCYGAENVEQQRGRGVFARSIEALLHLNRLGYGRGQGLILDLVYNPGGAFLPPAQKPLEDRYRSELGDRYGIVFDSLRALTNMPIARFAHDLVRRGQLEQYMSLLVHHFNPLTLPGLMCRSLVSVDHAGRLYDCDFNQALDLPPPAGPRDIFELRSLEELDTRRVATGPHCFGCSAGAGSSCGGALA